MTIVQILLRLAPFVALLCSIVEPRGAGITGGQPLLGRSQDEITTLWREYVRALRANDRERAMSLWSDRATRDVVFDWQLPDFPYAVAVANEESLAVLGVEPGADYQEIRIDWGNEERTFYAMQQGGRWVLANPVEALTVGWERWEGGRIVCIAPATDPPAPGDLESLDEMCQDLIDDFGVEMEKKIEYYKCETAEMVGALFGAEPATARSNERVAVAIAMKWTSHHEVAHIVIGQLARRRPTSLILEGAACHFAGATSVTRGAQLAWAKALVSDGDVDSILPLTREEAFWQFDDMNDPYALGTSFVGFLIEEFGIERFKEFYPYRDRQEDIDTALARVYGRAPEELDVAWRQWLLNREVPEVRLGTSDMATPVLCVEDPANDNDSRVGPDGDQSEQYAGGATDLRRVCLSVGEGRLYVDLRYRDLISLDGDSDWGVDGTYTRIAIDAGGPGRMDFGDDANATLLGGCDYRIDIGDCGVFFMRDEQVVATLLRAPTGKTLGDAELDRIQFSVPIAENATDTWRFAVVVGWGGGDCGRFRDGVGEFFGGGRPAESAEGNEADDVEPRFHDTIVPPGMSEEEVMNDYDHLTGRRVTLPMVSPRVD